jgi:Flp pilus assembly protein TadG
MRISRKARLARRGRVGRRGAAAIEFALVLPILLLVLGGIVDYARVYLELQMMTNAASEGARMAIISTDPSVTDASVDGLVRSFFGSSGADPTVTTVTISPSLDTVPPPPQGTVMNVTVQRAFDPIFLGFFRWFSPNIGFLPETLTYTASGRRM